MNTLCSAKADRNLPAGSPLTLIPLPPLEGEGTLTKASSFRTLAPHRGERAG